jgi:hypothetical protein
MGLNSFDVWTFTYCAREPVATPLPLQSTISAKSFVSRAVAAVKSAFAAPQFAVATVA